MTIAPAALSFAVCRTSARTCLPALGLSDCYYGLKERARQGKQLSAEELAFVGLYEPRPPSGGGWQPPDRFVAPYFANLYELSPEDSAMLSALMDVPRPDQLEFLG